MGMQGPELQRQPYCRIQNKQHTLNRKATQVTGLTVPVFTQLETWILLGKNPESIIGY